MEFDWRRAIDLNCEHLCTVAAQLIAMAGIQAGRTIETLPRQLYLSILALLRPAEYAARRLIVMAACKLFPESGLPLAKEKTDSGLPLANKKTASGLPPADATDDARAPFSPRGRRWMRAFRERTQTDEGDAADKAPSSGPSGHLLPRGEKEDRVAFALFDPFKPLGSPWLTPEEIAALDGPDYARWYTPAQPPDEPVAARALCRRIRALADALSDLDAQALRLARWRARRHLATCKPKRWSPLRPGRPPGWVKRPKTAVEEVLKECNYLGLEAWDTS